MKRLIIIVEGQTEEEFVKEILLPFFATHGIYSVTPIKIATSKVAKGGFVNYIHLKKDAKKYLSENETIVSMFVDFFRIPTTIPRNIHCLNTFQSVDDKIDCLEQSIAQDINHPNFIPYIQKHEFEALLFASNKGFESLFERKVHIKTQQIINDYPNPESINTGSESAPSKRILSIINDYEKVADGNMIALEVGIDAILEKCERFKKWIDTLIVRMQAT